MIAHSFLAITNTFILHYKKNQLSDSRIYVEEKTSYKNITSSSRSIFDRA